MTLPLKSDGDEFSAAEYNEIRDRLGAVKSYVSTANGNYWKLTDNLIFLEPGGSNLALLIQAAIDALGANGGTVDARAYVGTQTFSASITLTTNVTLLLGPGDFTANAMPVFKMQTDSVLKGAGHLATEITSNGTSHGVQSEVPGTGASNLIIQDLRFNNTSRTNAGAIGVNFQNVLASRVHNVTVVNFETSFYVQGAAYYNEFFSCEAVTAVTGWKIENGGHETIIYGGRALGCTTGVYINFADNVKVIGMAIETFTTGMNLGPLTPTGQPLILAVRLESATGTALLLGPGLNGAVIISPKFQAVPTEISGTGNSTTILRGGDLVTNQGGNPLVTHSSPGASANVELKVIGQAVNSRRTQLQATADWVLAFLTDAGATQFSPIQAYRSDGRAILGDGSRAMIGAPNSAPNDALLPTSSISFYLDQVANNLKVRVKYSDGTFKTGTVALV